MPNSPVLAPSKTHLLVIPSYNTGAKVLEVVREALAYWSPIWVVVDGSTDGTEKSLKQMAAGDPNLRVFVLENNQGKGAAVLHALDLAVKKGFTHILCMDADGQHPAAKIREFMALSKENPDCMVLGQPIFDVNAPKARVHGRKLSNFWSNVDTLWAGIGDSLFGFKLYPVEEMRRVMHGTRWARRFDFDPEVGIRLVWEGVRPINFPCPVRYIPRDQGGVSHFNYLRDNTLLTWMHFRLLITFFGKLFTAPRWRRWIKRPTVKKV